MNKLVQPTPILDPTAQAFVDSLAGGKPIPSLTPSEARSVLSGAQKAADVKLLDVQIKDVTLPVDLHVELDGVSRSPYGQDVFGFSATAEIDREAFGLTYNMALETGGVMIGKTVKIEIEGEAIRQDS